MRHLLISFTLFAVSEKHEQTGGQDSLESERKLRMGAINLLPFAARKESSKSRHFAWEGWIYGVLSHRISFPIEPVQSVDSSRVQSFLTFACAELLH